MPTDFSAGILHMREGSMKKRFGISAFWLKLTAMAGMLIDHIHTHFYTQTPYWLGFIGAFVAPVFVYFLIEGFFHTKSRPKYCFRLYVSAAAMGIGSAVLNLFLKARDVCIANNIFLTLAVLFTIIWLIETVRRQRHEEPRIYWLLLPATVLAFSCLMLEGGIYMRPFALITYVFYGKKQFQVTGYLLFSLILLGKALYSYYSVGMAYESLSHYLAFDREFLIAAAIPLICLYNGERGPSGKASKWMFYIFYPAHLWMIGILEYLSKG